MKRASYLLAAVLFVFASYASAHTKLTNSTPEADATLSASPESVELQFTKPVRLTAIVLERDGTTTDLADLPADNASLFNVGILIPLVPGNYVVEWRAVGEDTHVVSGDFQFTVEP